MCWLIDFFRQQLLEGTNENVKHCCSGYQKELKTNDQLIDSEYLDLKYIYIPNYLVMIIIF